MASVVTDMATSKPSKTLNLVYLIFGYFLASFAPFFVDLNFEQKIFATLIVGGFLSSILLFIKPLETTLIFILQHIKKDIIPYDSVPDQHFENRRSKIVNSPFLAEERAKITSIYFLAISLALSKLLLENVGIDVSQWLFLALIATSVIMFIVAIWETWKFGTLKIRVVAWYYTSFRFIKEFEDVQKEFQSVKDAIKRRDWMEANEIITANLGSKSIYAAFGKFCPKCKVIYAIGKYCPEDGTEMLTECKFCKFALVRKGTAKAPKYCTQCGKAVNEGPNRKFN